MSTKHKAAKPPMPPKPDEHEDDLIVVPRWQRSRLSFYFTMGMILIILLIFMVTGPMMAAMTGPSGGGGGGLYMTWEHPTDGTQSWSYRDFTLAKRSLSRFQEIMGRRGDTPSDEEAAFWLINDAVAKSAGLRVTNQELRDLLTPQFPDEAAFVQTVRNRGLQVHEFQEQLRTQLRIGRLNDMVLQSVTPNPSAIETRWKADHQEYAFEYVALETEPIQAELVANPPEDAEVQAWFDALSLPRQEQYKTQPKASARIVGLRFPIESESVTTQLLEQYPLPEDTDMDALIEEYYTSYRHSRFRRETPLEIDDPSDPGAIERAYFVPKEDVLEECRIEAPAWKAMRQWQQALSERESPTEGEGEAVDLAAEAQKLGLELSDDGEFRDRSEWAELEGLGGSSLAGILLRTDEGKLIPGLTVDRGGFVFARKLAGKDREMPSFADLKEKLVGDWATENAGQKAMERLTAVRDALDESEREEGVPYRPEVDSAAFVAATVGAGLETKRRDWAERRPALGADAGQDQRFFLTTDSLYTLREDEVSEPRLTFDGSMAILVRQAGLRDPETSGMKPRDILEIEQTLAGDQRQDFVRRNLNNVKWFEKHYALKFHEQTPTDS